MKQPQGADRGSSLERLRQILFQLEQALKDTTDPMRRKDVARSIACTKAIIKRLSMVILLMGPISARADALLDAILGNHEQYETRYEEEPEDCYYQGTYGDDAEPQHLSWNLGTNDAIPETEVIVDPYGNMGSGPYTDADF